MSLIEDIEPFFRAGRIFGVAPCFVNKTNVLLSRTGVVYSGICALLRVYLLYTRFEILISTDLDSKSLFLTISRTVLSECVILVDIFACICWHHKLQNSLECMQRYDLAVNLKPTSRYNSIRSWIALSFTVAYFLSIGWTTYIYEKYQPVESCILYVVLYISITFGILKFAAIAASLLHRFRHLNNLLKTGSSNVRTTTVLQS